MAIYKNINITEKFLNEDKNSYFVFGDNLIAKGYGGAASLRDHPQAIGFVTKKYPDNRDSSFYDAYEYEDVFFKQLNALKTLISNNPNKKYYISQLGGGLANRYNIWEKLIRENLIKELNHFENVVFCWEK